MSLINITDFLVGFVQAYMLGGFMSKYFKTKYSYGKSLFISTLILQISYLITNYIVYDRSVRVMMGILEFCTIGCIIYTGTLRRKIGQSLLVYGGFAGLDVLCTMIFYPWLKLVYERDLYISTRLLLGRSTFNMTMYMILVLIELVTQWKRNKGVKQISLLVFIMGFSQIWIFYVLYELDAQQVTDSAVLMAAFYSLVIVLGYFVVMEAFRQMEMQQHKQAELEQMALEKQYQYDYYQKAYAQGERLRDMRHDMRNQLQTVGALMQSNVDQDKNLAKEMVDKLAGRMS